MDVRTNLIVVLYIHGLSLLNSVSGADCNRIPSYCGR